MQIHELKLTKKRKRGKRVGRGGKRGVYSGRGIKGQRARTNKRLKLKRIGSLFSRHLPKIGGFTSLYPKAITVDISKLDDKYSNGEIVTPVSLKNKGIIKNSRYLVKIVGKGNLSKKLTIKDCKATKSSKEIIEKAGGTIKS